jgi:release factor glutamine methyltransferase
MVKQQIEAQQTIGGALAWGRQQLQQSPSPAVDSRLLLEHILQVNHTYLVGHATDPLPATHLAAYQALVARAAQGEPIPYLVGHAPFYGRSFLVNPVVLIPRPETEELVQQVIAWAKERPGTHLVDVGTGSGCIAVTLACELPDARVTAVDVSAAALNVARQNAERLGAAGRITFHEGSLLEPLPAPVDAIVANLPYIADDEWTSLDVGVKWYEPAGALRGGPDGLDVIRELLPQAHTRLQPGGAIFLEIGWQQGEAARQLAAGHFPQAEVRLLADFAGHDRFVTIQL